MSEQERKRERIVDLIRAQVPVGTIMDIVGVSRATVFNVKKRLKDTEDVEETVKNEAPSLGHDAGRGGL